MNHSLLNVIKSLMMNGNYTTKEKMQSLADIISANRFSSRERGIVRSLLHRRARELGEFLTKRKLSSPLSYFYEGTSFVTELNPEEDIPPRIDSDLLLFSEWSYAERGKPTRALDPSKAETSLTASFGFDQYSRFEFCNIAMFDGETNSGVMDEQSIHFFNEGNLMIEVCIKEEGLEYLRKLSFFQNVENTSLNEGIMRLWYSGREEEYEGIDSSGQTQNRVIELDDRIAIRVYIPI